MEILLTVLFLSFLTIIILVIHQFQDRNTGDKGMDSDDKNSNTVNLVGIPALTNTIVFILILIGISTIVGLVFFPPEINYLQRPSLGIFLLAVGLGLILSFWGNDQGSQPHYFLVVIAVMWATSVIREIIVHEHALNALLKQYCYWLGIGAWLFAFLIPFSIIYRIIKPMDIIGQRNAQWSTGITIIGILYSIWASGCGVLLFEQIKP